MTPEEAISVIKTEIGQFIIDEKWKNALALAISALEKQIPKKYVRDGITNKCPSCDLTYMFVRSIHGDGSYCTKCGQKIDMRGET